MSLRRVQSLSPEERVKRSRNNPYIAKIAEKGDRIFQFEDIAEDSARVHELLQSKPQCYVELGSGSGRHLITLAQLNPKAVCIGFELRYKRAYRTIEKAEQAGVKNVFVLKTNARDLPEIFPDQSIAAVFVNFPDPWEKTRARKHRLLQTEFLAALHKKLCQGGILSFKTDHREYFESVIKILEEQANYLILKSSVDLHRSEYVESNIRTEFEDLFLAQGLPVCYCEAEARSD